MSKGPNIILCDINRSLATSWADAFADYPEVAIVCADIRKIPESACIATAGNSYGIMSGGVDLVLRDFFGGGIQERVQDVIAKEYGGEQPIGTSFLVKTRNRNHPLMAHTPTMQRPMRVGSTMNAYYAMLATLIATRNLKGNVIIPGFCTATGDMPSMIAARQMVAAYASFQWNRKKPKTCWDDFVRKDGEKI